VTARGSDGLPARVSGPWTQEKLAYLERYATMFMRAMAPKRTQRQWTDLVYLDFLAGPGRGIDRKTRREFDGSPLRALNSGDCHEVAASVVNELSGRTLALAFVDPEGIEVTFNLFRILARRSIDILRLFPGGIGVARNFAAFARRKETPLDDLIPGWRNLPSARLAAGRRVSSAELEAADRPFVVALQARMAEIGYQYSDQGSPTLRMTGGSACTTCCSSRSPSPG
jgi:hypothetical protein